MNLRAEGYKMVMTGPDICEVLNVSRGTLWSRIKSGEWRFSLEHRRHKQGRLRATRDSVQAILDSMEKWGEQ